MGASRRRIAPGEASPNDRPDGMIRPRGGHCDRGGCPEFINMPSFDDPLCNGQVDTSVWDAEERAERG